MIIEAELETTDQTVEDRLETVQIASDGGYERGYAEGVQAEYDRFWDAFQQNGERTDYEQAFRLGWTDNNFNPKYVLRPTKCSFMFGLDCGITEIKEGVLDLSQLTKLNNMFYNNSSTVTVPPFDMATITDVASGFYGCKINPIVLNNVREDCKFGIWHAIGHLKDLSITGTVGTTWSLYGCYQLTKQSIINVINALSATVTDQTLTLNANAVKVAFEKNSGAKDGNTSEEWLALIATKSNWTITLQ